MLSIGAMCHELRIRDVEINWRIMYRINSDAIIILEVYENKSGKTPKYIIDVCKERIKVYNRESK